MIELYGTKTCPYTAEIREDLQWQGTEFLEHDVKEDSRALERLLQLTGGNRIVPVVVEEGRVVQIGVNGRGCYVDVP